MRLSLRNWNYEAAFASQRTLENKPTIELTIILPIDSRRTSRVFSLKPISQAIGGPRTKLRNHQQVPLDRRDVSDELDFNGQRAIPSLFVKNLRTISRESGFSASEIRFDLLTFRLF